jgi:hypothetical protein
MRQRHAAVVLQNPGKRLDLALACGVDRSREQVNVAKLRRAHVLVGEVGILVVLHVRDGKIAAAETSRGHAGPGVDVAVDEREQRVHARAELEVIEQQLKIVSGQWRRANLDADGGVGARRRGRRGGQGGERRQRGGDADGGGGLQRFTTIHGLSRHDGCWLRIHFQVSFASQRRLWQPSGRWRRAEFEVSRERMLTTGNAEARTFAAVPAKPASGLVLL